MFGVMKRRPIIPTRLPESLTPVLPDAMRPVVEVAPTLIKTPVAKSENTETPPLTPSSDTTGEASTDEPSVEELTVEEVCKAITAAKEGVVNLDEAEVTSDETPDTEDAETESDDDLEATTPANRVGFNLFLAWFSFWSIALAVGLLAYYLNKHQEIIAARVTTDTTQEVNLLLMPREKWDDSTNVMTKPSSFVAQRVVVVQTDTEHCDTIITCTKLLNAMKLRQQKRREGVMKYNFLLSTDGCIYEALGWQEPSPLYPDMPTMVVAFIGNYQTLAPSTMQLSQFQSLLEASEELKYLVNSYTIVGRKQFVIPRKLFAYLSALQHWDKKNSDIDDEHIDVELKPFPMFDDQY